MHRENEQRSGDPRGAVHCGGSIFHSPFSRTNAISPVSLSSPFWRSTFSVAESPLVDDPLIWNFVPSISFASA